MNLNTPLPQTKKHKIAGNKGTTGHLTSRCVAEERGTFVGCSFCRAFSPQKVQGLGGDRSTGRKTCIQRCA